MKTRIGHLLTRAGLVTEVQLSRALEVQNFAGGRIGTLLLERGAFAEDDLGKTLALQHGCGYIPWSVLADIPPETLAILPARFALKHSAIPYDRGEGWVKMALRDPSDLRVFDELVFVTGRKVIVGVAPEVRIYQSLERYYGKLRAPRFALLAQKLSRSQRAPSARAPGQPPAPDFFAEMATTAPDRETGPSLTLAPALDSSPAPPLPAAEEASTAGWASPMSPEPSSFGWAHAGEPDPPKALDPIPWDDTTSSRSKRKAKAPAPIPFEREEVQEPELEQEPEQEPDQEAERYRTRDQEQEREPEREPEPEPEREEEEREAEAPFDIGTFEPAEEFEGADEFPAVTAATERDAIADAVLEALARRFERAAIFSSRSEGVAGWAASGEGVNASEVRSFSATWTEPSVFMNARLSRAFYLGPLPLLPRHDQLAVALGGWPGECVVQPVFIGERPVAFVLVTVQQPGAVSVEDLDYLRELSDAASSAFANAIRLRKREI